MKNILIFAVWNIKFHRAEKRYLRKLDQPEGNFSNGDFSLTEIFCKDIFVFTSDRTIPRKFMKHLLILDIFLSTAICHDR